MSQNISSIVKGNIIHAITILLHAILKAVYLYFLDDTYMFDVSFMESKPTTNSQPLCHTEVSG